MNAREPDSGRGRPDDGGGYRAPDLLRALLPEGACGEEATASDAEAELWPGEEALAERAVASRRREVAAGRACARRALSRLGAPVASLPPDPDGLPRWPPKVCGSITHTRGYAAAAVVWRGQLSGLGIDAERVSRVRADMMRLVALPDELAWLGDQRAEEAARARALLFAAKEAAYKCQFPRTRLVFDFLDARFEVFESPPGTRGAFRVRFGERDTARRRAQAHAEPPVAGPPPIEGAFCVAEDLVICVARWPAAPERSGRPDEAPPRRKDG